MKDRRLKIGMVSMHIVASWGKDIGDKIRESLPDGTKILRQQDNFSRGTLDVLLYNESFEEVDDGHEIPRINLGVQVNDAKNAPQIILPRY
jgi:hypothetical protein